MRRHLVLVTAATTAFVLVAHVWAQPPGKPSAAFDGYWMGVDPLDGGDSRRSLVQQGDGTFALAGRDTLLTLCDGTDRGFVSFNDGEVVARNVMQSSALTIRCANGASVVLHARYELVARGRMIEVTTMPNGTAVTTIVFHKMSQD